MKNSKNVEKYCILQCKKKNHESSSTLKKIKINFSSKNVCVNVFVQWSEKVFFKGGLVLLKYWRNIVR